MKGQICLDINIAQAMGAYSVQIYLGSNRTAVNVMLDTGSSTLAIDLNKYKPDKDQLLQPSPYAQDVVYGSGGWAGPVVHTEIELDHSDKHLLNDAPIALLESQQQNNFQQADGIWGLAYHHLNKAYDLTTYLKQQQPLLSNSYPWPFQIENTPGAIKDFRNFLKKHPEHDITPLFTAFEAAEVVSNKFTFVTHRAIKYVPQNGMSLEQVAAEPHNQGQLIIGHFPLSPQANTVKVIHDAYYNVVLKSIRVDGHEPHTAPPLDGAHVHNFFSNAIVDSGSSFLMLQKELYTYVMNCFEKINPNLNICIEDFNKKLRQSEDYKNPAFDLSLWPDIYFTLEGLNGQQTELKCSPKHYWQHNAKGPDNWFCLLMNQLEKWPDQTILGLPLMNAYTCTFDRSSHGLGVIHFQ